MLGYPAHAANADFDLAEATGEAKYRDAAIAIARTYVKRQDEDGTWPLKVLEKDGSPVRANRLVPNRYLLGMFDRAAAATGDAAFAAARELIAKDPELDGSPELRAVVNKMFTLDAAVMN